MKAVAEEGFRNGGLCVEAVHSTLVVAHLIKGEAGSDKPINLLAVQVEVHGQVNEVAFDQIVRRRKGLKRHSCLQKGNCEMRNPSTPCEGDGAAARADQPSALKSKTLAVGWADLKSSLM